jgi:hypothetical protein
MSLSAKTRDACWTFTSPVPAVLPGRIGDGIHRQCDSTEPRHLSIRHAAEKIKGLRKKIRLIRSLAQPEPRQLPGLRPEPHLYPVLEESTQS